MVSSIGKSLVRMRYTFNGFEWLLNYPTGRLGQPCWNLARISTKIHNFEQNFIRLLSSMFTMLLSKNRVYKCINAILIYHNDVNCTLAQIFCYVRFSTMSLHYLWQPCPFAETFSWFTLYCPYELQVFNSSLIRKFPVILDNYKHKKPHNFLFCAPANLQQ